MEGEKYDQFRPEWIGKEYKKRGAALGEKKENEKGHSPGTQKEDSLNVDV